MGIKINRPTAFLKKTMVGLSTVSDAKRIQTPIIENSKAEVIRQRSALATGLVELSVFDNISGSSGVVVEMKAEKAFIPQF
jgi:hypothetical protein